MGHTLGTGRRLLGCRSQGKTRGLLALEKTLKRLKANDRKRQEGKKQRPCSLPSVDKGSRLKALACRSEAALNGISRDQLARITPPRSLMILLFVNLDGAWKASCISVASLVWRLVVTMLLQPCLITVTERTERPYYGFGANSLVSFFDTGTLAS
ncbi:hypothetical protein TESG_05049 [Trichophyton tonsurans CBS 112818]|uniref:Uncharacterized protein n=2 Tax=Trichophyton TaxID=5550 RepID=F2PSJ3_TRIEC|nr:hypothetical protein TESG_05049 [Trichophyton tonsurans CBS 112818]EGE04772.1 hypothetical protein TEQG_03945 [Trichophyton equinum CBS 127.97]